MSGEAAFRAAERVLDEALARDLAALRARGVRVVDESARTYHYKNHALEWAVRFEERRPRGGETALVVVRLSAMEPPDAAPLEVGLRRTAELFYTGQAARWADRAALVFGPEAVAARGLGALVADALDAGWAAVARVP